MTVHENLKSWTENSKSFSLIKEHILPQLKDKTFYPSTENILRAFKECPYDNLKVVILGQDPYHDGSAVGIAFDNYIQQKKTSPSLRNILIEMEKDVGYSWDGEASALGHLPEQGVLLLNTALTVSPSKPASHTELWKPFTEQLITDLQQKDNIIWILWGKHAQGYKHLITNPTHKFIESAHPSPLSASRGFFGSKPFSKCNALLKDLGLSPIKW